jgi:EAL domain-containing protein (putative c-di-GMP-specific phosphodiesterase class I)
VVAEGVESHEQQQLLREFGCDLLQGFLYARPLPAAGVPPFVEALASHETDLQAGG